VIQSRQFTKGQKLFIIMAIFVCGLLFYANGVAFNLISAPAYVDDIIAFSALAVAVALTVITLTIVIKDKRSLFVKTQKTNVANSSKESIETPSTILSPVDSQENADKVDLNSATVQTANESDKAPVTLLAKSYRKRNLIAILIAIIAGLLLYVNVVSFKLIALPEFSMYVAAVGAAGLIGVIFIVALADKRRGAFARIQKASVISAVKESNVPVETVPSSGDFQASTNVDEIDETDIQTLNVSDEAQVSALPKAKSSKKRNALIFIIVIAVGLLFFANCVAFGLISLPGYFDYVFVAGASALTIIIVALVLVYKRKGALPKATIAEVISAIKKSNAVPETPDIVSSLTIAQTSANKVESDEPSTQSIEAFDETPDTVSSPVIGRITDEVEPNPSAVQTAIESDKTPVTPLIAAFETAKVPLETPAPIIPPAKGFRKRTLYVIIVGFTVGLLFFANVAAFGLISLPEYVTYAVVACAVVLAAIALTMILGDKIKVLGNRVKRFVSEPQIREIINEIKKTDQAPDTVPASVIAQASLKKVDSYAELLRQFGVQKTTSRLEADALEQEKQLPKKPVIPPTKVMCPACRKEFNLPIYERDYIVDFGQPKRSNLIKRCPHCQTNIPLKRRGVFEEDDIRKD
jgi:hypothetical protein